MDGAVKYVKGDATAGLIITAVNIVGGMLMGMFRQGLDFNTALNNYAVLTIGDGLVSQIPSLLISLSTGILVTKGSQGCRFWCSTDQTAFWRTKYDVYGRCGTDRPWYCDTAEYDHFLSALGIAFVVTGRMMAGTIETAQIENEANTGGDGGRRDPAAGECDLASAGRSDRAGVWLWYHSAG